MKDIVCSNCGSKIPEGNAFCTECGTPAPVTEEKTKKEKKKEEKPEAEVKKETEAPKDKPVEKTPLSDNVFHKEIKPYAKALHPAAYFFLLLLFAVPVVGLIASIAMSSSSKNENLANFGKAVFIWKIIFIVITVVTAIVLLIVLHNMGITFGLISQTFSNAFASLVK